MQLELLESVLCRYINSQACLLTPGMLFSQLGHCWHFVVRTVGCLVASHQPVFSCNNQNHVHTLTAVPWGAKAAQAENYCLLKNTPNLILLKTKEILKYKETQESDAD
jgi:hypothetical protein